MSRDPVILVESSSSATLVSAFKAIRSFLSAFHLHPHPHPTPAAQLFCSDRSGFSGSGVVYGWKSWCQAPPHLAKGPCSRSLAVLLVWACASVTVAWESTAGTLCCILWARPGLTAPGSQPVSSRSLPLIWSVGLWLPAWSSSWEWNVAFCLDKLWQGANRSYLWNSFKWKFQKVTFETPSNSSFSRGRVGVSEVEIVSNRQDCPLVVKCEHSSGSFQVWWMVLNIHDFYIQQSSSAHTEHNARDTEIGKAVTSEAQTPGDPNH